MTAVAEPDIDQADGIERVVVWDTGEVLDVHPAASLFPMMSDEELDDLAEDIRHNGQADPVVVTPQRLLIDGRNRLEACRRAEVSPDIIEVSLEDPAAYILSKNVSRRHLTKGQQAMAAVQARVFLKDGSRVNGKDTVRALAKDTGVSRARIGYAVVVLEFAPELAPKVRLQGLPLNEAYAKALDRKAAAQSDAVKLERLKVEEPDLAELVVDERLTLAGAMAEWAERQRVALEEQEKARKYREVTTRQLDQAVSFLDPRALDPAELAASLLHHFEPSAAGDAGGVSAERLRGCAAVLTAMAAAIAADRGSMEEDERDDEEG